MQCIDDLRADDNGVWVHGGKPRRKYIIDFDQSTSEIIDATLVSDDSVLEEIDHFTLVRVYHRHQGTPTFQRRISYVVDSKGQTVQYAVVQYLFEDGCEVPVILPPHGNAKIDTTPYRHTQKSTLSKMKDTSGKPKSVVS